MSGRDPFVIRKYLGVQAAWFTSAGLQMVMYPFLLKVTLDLPAHLIGVATFAMTLPMFLFMIPGGALADRFDGRRILALMHSLAVIPPALLATVILLDQLTYPILLIYGCAMGFVGAFSQPARDSLLSRVVQADGERITLQQAVGMASLTMFACQILGMLVAMTADYIGPQFVVFIQGLVMFSSIWLVAALRVEAKEAPATAWSIGGQFHDMGDGIIEAFKSPQIMPVVVIAFLIGMFYIGSFQVLMPVLVSDFYGGESWRMGLGPLTFFSGTIVTSTILMRRGGVERAGLTLVFAVASGMVTMFLVAIFREAPYLLFLSFIFLWGLGAGIAITLSRSIVQELAPESHRGRLLSVFSTGFMGGAPIGALVIGPLVEQYDPHDAALVPAFSMLTCLTILTLTTQLTKIKLKKHAPGEDLGNPDLAAANAVPAAAEAVAGQKPD